MRRPLFAALSAAAVLITVALAPPAGAAPSSGTHRHNVKVCSTAKAGSVACNAIRSDQVTDAGTVAPKATTVPAGAKIPADIQSAYKLAGGAQGKTVAIVDAYNAPSAEADLAVYRTQFGLPVCSTANGCFRKVSQTGSTRSLPRTDGGWAQEISLDIDMVSAACPGCKILLVEASSSSFTNLAAAVNYAAAQPGVVAISNSYGGGDSSANSTVGQAYRSRNGIAITASTGDNGYGVQSPASFGTVVAVGGTSLVKDSSSRGWSESAWSGAGSGCSTLNKNPGYQTGTGCANNGKANADVSAVADPNTGVAVYDSFAYQGYSGWMQFGGTSASSPIIASVYAQATTPLPAYPASLPWGNPSALNDAVGGSNGSCAQPSWCNGVGGWDGPTGLGTPNGFGSF
jgi:subtilase family serine protease